MRRHHHAGRGLEIERLANHVGDAQVIAEAIAALSERVNAIFQACSFQDLTGQRIRRAIRQLQQVETMLEGLVPGAGAPVGARVEVRGAAPTVADPDAPDLAQAEIDRLMGG